MSLFQYPKNLGKIEGVDVFLKLGRFGPYIQIDKLNVSVPKGIDADDIGLSEALVWVEEKKKADAPIMHYDELPVSKGKGRFCFSYFNMNISIFLW